MAQFAPTPRSEYTKTQYLKKFIEIIEITNSNTNTIAVHFSYTFAHRKRYVCEVSHQFEICRILAICIDSIDAKPCK